jgi:hypothetical protein
LFKDLFNNDAIERDELINFEKYLRCVNYTSASFPSFQALMTTMQYDALDPTKIVKCASEPVNMMALDIALRQNFDFTQIRQVLRNECGDNCPDIVPDSENRPHNFVISDFPDIIQRKEISREPWEQLVLRWKRSINIMILRLQRMRPLLSVVRMDYI